MHPVSVVLAKHSIFTEGSTSRTEGSTGQYPRERGISHWEMRAPGGRGARFSHGWARPASVGVCRCLSVSAGRALPAAGRCRKGAARRGGGSGHVALLGPGPAAPMAAPQDPLPAGEAGAAGSGAGGHGCPEGRRPLPGLPGLRDGRCAGCGPQRPSRAGQSRGCGSREPGEERSPGRPEKSLFAAPFPLSTRLLSMVIIDHVLCWCDLVQLVLSSLLQYLAC